MRLHRKVVVVGSLPESLVIFRGPLLKAMTACGHRVIGCAPPAPPSVKDALGDIGVEYREVPLDRAGLSPLRDTASSAALFRLFRELAPDTLLTYTAKPVIYGSLAGYAAGIPSIFAMITGLGCGFAGVGVKSRLAGALLPWLYRGSLRNCRTVFFQNPDDRDHFQRIGILRDPKKAVLINGSGVDLHRFRPVPPPLEVSFLLIGRLLSIKGLYQYAEAARQVRARHPSVPFRIAGWTDRTPAAIRERDLRSWVDQGLLEYLGRLEDVRPAISAASVFVLPSLGGEGTPRTILEAIAMGRPIITTDSPGCRETVRHGVNGFLVPVGDVPSLVAAMEQFIACPALVETMGRESRRIAVEKYDVHKVNGVILEAMELG